MPSTSPARALRTPRTGRKAPDDAYGDHDLGEGGLGPWNVRNGSRPKTVLTDAVGQVRIGVPRDRAGTFEHGHRQAASAQAGQRGGAGAVVDGQGPDQW